MQTADREGVVIIIHIATEAAEGARTSSPVTCSSLGRELSSDLRYDEVHTTREGSGPAHGLPSDSGDGNMGRQVEHRKLETRRLHKTLDTDRQTQDPSYYRPTGHDGALHRQ